MTSSQIIRSVFLMMVKYLRDDRGRLVEQVLP